MDCAREGKCTQPGSKGVKSRLRFSPGLTCACDERSGGGVETKHLICWLRFSGSDDAEDTIRKRHLKPRDKTENKNEI